MDPYLRAGDADRERTVAALRTHTTAGRLTLEEFSDRAASAYAATTLADLARLTADLPADRLTPAVTTATAIGASVVPPAIGLALLLVAIVTVTVVVLLSGNVGLANAFAMMSRCM